MEADKSKDLQDESTRLRSKRVNDLVPIQGQRPKNQRTKRADISLWVQSQDKAAVSAQRQSSRRNSLVRRENVTFVFGLGLQVIGQDSLILGRTICFT